MAEGAFVSRDHPTSGRALVLNDGSAPGSYASKDCETDNGPDLNVYDTVVIWCGRFAVPFGRCRPDHPSAPHRLKTVVGWLPHGRSAVRPSRQQLQESRAVGREPYSHPASRIDFRRVRSLRLARRMAGAMNGAASLEKPTG